MSAIINLFNSNNLLYLIEIRNAMHVKSKFYIYINVDKRMEISNLFEAKSILELTNTKLKLDMSETIKEIIRHS